jgi:hypothetical protein
MPASKYSAVNSRGVGEVKKEDRNRDRQSIKYKHPWI